MNSYQKYLTTLKNQYTSYSAICEDVIMLQSRLYLPKPTEHFISDLHGEYSVFKHLMRGCSGVIKEKAIEVFGDSVANEEINALCSYIYYPENIPNDFSKDQYRILLLRTLRVARNVSSKYPREIIRQSIEEGYVTILDELLHAQVDEMNQQYIYHLRIIDAMIEVNAQNEYMRVLSKLIRNFAIDKIHIVGDIYDRGKYPDKIIDYLIEYKRVDIQWGNHDILYMAASLGNIAAIITVVKNCYKYDSLNLLEKGYGIPLRTFFNFARSRYTDITENESIMKFINTLLYKAEKAIMDTYPEYRMSYRQKDTTSKFDDYEKHAVEELQESFLASDKLQRHALFLFKKGSLYKVCDQYLLFHGCMPLDIEGHYQNIVCIDKKTRKGKAYFDYIQNMIEDAFINKTKSSVDSLWYLWCGENSPMCGREIGYNQKNETQNSYFYYIQDAMVCKRILSEFGLTKERACIVNGHTPVKTHSGEKPIQSMGKRIVIDGGFCKNYHHITGVGGYTLITNSHKLRLKTHRLGDECKPDVDYINDIVHIFDKQIRILDTDEGALIIDKINDLKNVLSMINEDMF